MYKLAIDTTETAIAATKSNIIACTHLFWNKFLADAADEAVKDAHLLLRL